MVEEQGGAGKVCWRGKVENGSLVSEVLKNLALFLSLSSLFSGQPASIVPEHILNGLGVQDAFGPEVELFEGGFAEAFLAPKCRKSSGSFLPIAKKVVTE